MQFTVRWEVRAQRIQQHVVRELGTAGAEHTLNTDVLGEEIYTCFRLLP